MLGKILYSEGDGELAQTAHSTIQQFSKIQNKSLFFLKLVQGKFFFKVNAFCRSKGVNTNSKQINFFHNTRCS